MLAANAASCSAGVIRSNSAAVITLRSTTTILPTRCDEDRCSSRPLVRPDRSGRNASLAEHVQHSASGDTEVLSDRGEGRPGLVQPPGGSDVVVGHDPVTGSDASTPERIHDRRSMDAELSGSRARRLARPVPPDELRSV